MPDVIDNDDKFAMDSFEISLNPKAESRLQPITRPRMVAYIEGCEKNPAIWDWSLLSKGPKATVRKEEWFIVRLTQAVITLRDNVEQDPSVMAGMPVLRGTRFPLSRLFAELADGLSINVIADDFDLDLNDLSQIMDGFALYFGRPIK